jgi:glutamate 5-kinase
MIPHGTGEHDPSGEGNGRSIAVRSLVDRAQRIIIKVGSSVATSSPPVWPEIVSDISALRRQGKRVVVVASGAVTLGRITDVDNACGNRRRRVWASVGQMQLTAMAERFFSQGGIRPAQVLVRFADSQDEVATRKIANLISDLCENDILPIVNEDDSNRSNVDHFVDNDHLASWLARIWQADLIVFLTDTDGVYDSDPKMTVMARRIHHLNLQTLAGSVLGGAGRSSKGTGGMTTKVSASRIALEYGCSSIIASGLRPLPLSGALATGCCTVVCHHLDTALVSEPPARARSAEAGSGS